MDDLRVLRQEIGGNDPDSQGLATTIEAGPTLITLVREAGLRPVDFRTSSEAECLILKESAPEGRKAKRLCEYEDNAETRGMRAQIDALNEALERAELSLDDDAPPELDPGRRRLRRIFSRRSFQQGGRLFGGFWQTMRKADRFRFLRIAGQEIAECDYGQANPRLAYAMLRRRPPEGDLYAIPGFEKHREGVKKLFLSLLFSEGPVIRMPRGVRKAGLFLPSHRTTEVVAAIETKHPQLAKFFCLGWGHEIQFHESELLIDVVSRLFAGGVTALPVHDAVLVARPNAEVARMVMQLGFRERFEQDCPVEVAFQ